jgi:hypothetical protein
MYPKSIELKCGKLSSKLRNMTFILGARRIAGVVLIADRKITNLDEGLHLIMATNYLQNLSYCFWFFRFYGIFELFRAKIRNHIRTQNCIC